MQQTFLSKVNSVVKVGESVEAEMCNKVLSVESEFGNRFEKGV